MSDTERKQIQSNLAGYENKISRCRAEIKTLEQEREELRELSYKVKNEQERYYSLVQRMIARNNTLCGCTDCRSMSRFHHGMDNTLHGEETSKVFNEFERTVENIQKRMVEIENAINDLQNSIASYSRSMSSLQQQLRAL